MLVPALYIGRKKESWWFSKPMQQIYLGSVLEELLNLRNRFHKKYRVMNHALTHSKFDLFAMHFRNRSTEIANYSVYQIFLLFIIDKMDLKY